MFTAVRRAAGDVNDDGQISADDLISLTKHLLGVKTSYLKTTADISGDGKVDLIDMIKLKKLLSR